MSTRINTPDTRRCPPPPRKTPALLATACIALCLPHHAYAYLDPGTGSIIIQGLIASAAAGLVVVRTYWHRLKGFYKKSPEGNSSDGKDDDGAERSDEG